MATACNKMVTDVLEAASMTPSDLVTAEFVVRSLPLVASCCCWFVLVLVAMMETVALHFDPGRLCSKSRMHKQCVWENLLGSSRLD